MESLASTFTVPKEALKIKTYECFTKFQEARPAHRSNLVNK
jgi:hypothetical protein